MLTKARSEPKPAQAKPGSTRFKKPATAVVSDADIAAAIARGKRVPSHRVVEATYDESSDQIMIRFENGTTLAIPRELLQGLAGATPSQLRTIEILGPGTGLNWPALDVAHDVPGLIDGVFGTELDVLGSHLRPRALLNIADPTIDMRGIATHQFPLKDFKEACATMESGVPLAQSRASSGRGGWVGRLTPRGLGSAFRAGVGIDLGGWGGMSSTRGA